MEDQASNLRRLVEDMDISSSDSSSAYGAENETIENVVQDNSSAMAKVIAVTSLSITLIGCLAFIYILLRTNIIFKNQTVADAGIKDNIKLEDVSKITVTYKGDKAFAGGRLSKADFVVEVT